MLSIRSMNYFRDILNVVLNYFGRKQKLSRKPLLNILTVENNDEDLLEIINDEPKVEPKNLLHNSYKLFYKRLPPTVARDTSVRQTRVREYYKRLFDDKKDFSPKELLGLNSANKQSNEFNGDHIRKVLKYNSNLNEEIDDKQQDAEDNQQQINEFV